MILRIRKEVRGTVERKYFMGVDQGTTGTTVLLLDEDWNLAASSHKEHKQYYPQPGWVEHDGKKSWRR